MKDTIVLVVDVICITVLGIVLAFNEIAHPEMFYSIFGLLGTIAGAAGRTVVPNVARAIIKKMRWIGNK